MYNVRTCVHTIDTECTGVNKIVTECTVCVHVCIPLLLNVQL